MGLHFIFQALATGVFGGLSRKTKPSNPSDYNSYSSVKELHIGALTATLKGDREIYTLAIWSADGYTYSVRLSNGISQPAWHDFIGSL